MDVFSVLWSDPKLYNQKPRPARESHRSEFKEPAVEGDRWCQEDLTSAVVMVIFGVYNSFRLL
jgi:hypothetical protein